MPASPVTRDHRQLLEWYRANRRELPWRATRDPYRIWISEVMLQQTTVVAVIPYYERFLQTFPDVRSLALAPESEVLKAWAGLGYYSRARNLHRSAKHLHENGFPRTAAELIELPGFGPYTSAAVASIAFDDPAGVLDGNVIRVLCRRYGWDFDWWMSGPRKQLQERADDFARAGQPAEINQALMELGATVCTPQSPACLMCPWVTTCEARKQNAVDVIPKPKPRKKIEIWIWEPEVHRRKNQVGLIRNETGPVLKGQWLFPGTFRKAPKKPDSFDARHGITHHDIFVRIDRKAKKPSRDLQWFDVEELTSVNPSKLLGKVLDAGDRE